MTYLITTQTPGSMDDFKAVCAVVEAQPIDGLLARYAGVNERGLAVTTVWASKAHSDRFTSEQLVPALRQVHGDIAAEGPPQAIDFEVADESIPVAT